MHFSSPRDVNRHTVPWVQVPENLLHQNNEGSTDQITLEEEVIGIPTPQSDDNNIETQNPVNDIV